MIAILHIVNYTVCTVPFNSFSRADNKLLKFCCWFAYTTFLAVFFKSLSQVTSNIAEKIATQPTDVYTGCIKKVQIQISRAITYWNIYLISLSYFAPWVENLVFLRNYHNR